MGLICAYCFVLTTSSGQSSIIKCFSQCLRLKMLDRRENVNGGTTENKIINGGIPFLFMLKLRYENKPDLFTGIPRKCAKKFC
jgi:hypothetical protein